MGIEGTYLNIIKAIYGKPTTNIILNEKSTNVPLKIKNRTGMFTFTFRIQRSTGSPSHNNHTRGRHKRHPKEEVKLSLFADEMIPHIDNPKDSTKILL